MGNTPDQSDAPVDARDINANEWPRRELAPLPAHRRAGFQVVIQQDALKAIHAHGKSILDMEICGFLVGGVFRDDKGPWLHITGAIEGRHATHHAAQVTFTAATWEYAHEVLERDHPGERIVGWYHTHPDFGVFLSGMDLFIQENFFNLPWQVALVYDPVREDEGFFIWQEGKSERQPHIVHRGGWTDSQHESAIPIAEAPPVAAPAVETPAEEPETVVPAPEKPVWSAIKRALDRFFS